MCERVPCGSSPFALLMDVSLDVCVKFGNKSLVYFTGCHVSPLVAAPHEILDSRTSPPLHLTIPAVLFKTTIHPQPDNYFLSKYKRRKLSVPSRLQNVYRSLVCSQSPLLFIWPVRQISAVLAECHCAALRAVLEIGLGLMLLFYQPGVCC